MSEIDNELVRRSHPSWEPKAVSRRRVSDSSAALSVIRRAPHEVQNSRRLQLKATNF
jgi:hypothetical protein